MEGIPHKCLPIPKNSSTPKQLVLKEARMSILNVAPTLPAKPTTTKNMLNCFQTLAYQAQTIWKAGRSQPGLGWDALIDNQSSMFPPKTHLTAGKSPNQCYKYGVGEYIAEGPKRNYRIYRRKCRRTSAIYQQSKKYKNSKNYYIFEKIGKYRDKIGKYRYILKKIGKYRDQIGKKSQKNRGKYRGDILQIYRQWVDIAIYCDVADISTMFITLI